MAGTQTWIVTISGNRSLGDIRKELTEIGFDINQVLEEIGCITGKANAAIAGKARKIPGVADVSPEHPPIDIGGPDSSQTW